MANPMRAEAQVSIEAGVFTLAYSLNALSAIKAARPGVLLSDLLEGLGDKGADAAEDITLIIWAGMQKHHKGMSIEDVGDLVELADIAIWSLAITAAMGGGAARPSADASGELATPNPQAAAAKS